MIVREFDRTHVTARGPTNNRASRTTEPEWSNHVARKGVSLECASYLENHSTASPDAGIDSAEPINGRGVADATRPTAYNTPPIIMKGKLTSA
ncbi:hypothetical protein EVAR_61951_1 [Eumeta japonica]|uniref:Uncharacterized protein n=1 Tax=Eumeta variegata TaxID=151549 RepID=A0A4C1ZHN6_EUMVA|nr:hypothetical protein EVAR_61951_1 [Eumeta japonica]